MKRILTSVCLIIAFNLSAFGQIQIKGKIVGDQGAPVSGATVTEQGTAIGVSSSNTGEYSITVKNEVSVLSFSSLGYATQNIVVGAQRTINVTLREDAIRLNDLVVTGYGQTVSKDKLTAAISKVSGEVLESGVRSNVLSALSGSVTGVRVTTNSGQPGQSPNIVIRGGAALDGSGTPLYVIDGVQRDNMDDINSNDIESIEVLKDAAATALYGARANTGVVLVTTKKGRAGKAEITFKANYGINYLRNTNDFLAADDYLYYLRIASYRSGNIAALSAAGPFGTGNDYYADGNKSTTGQYSPMFLGADNNFLLGQGWKTMTDPITGKEIIYSEFCASQGSVRDVASTQDYNVSITGGNEKGQYYASLGYYDEKGFPIMSYYNRLSFNTNGSYKVTPWLTSNSGIIFSTSESDKVLNYRSAGEAEFFGIMFSSPPTLRERNLNGDLIACTTNYQNGNWEATLPQLYRRNTNYKFSLNQGLKLDITKHLNLKVNGMWYFNLNEKESFNKAFTSTATTTDTNRATSAGYDRMLAQTYNAILGYNNSWCGHTVSAIAGAEFYDRYRFALAASGKGADSDDFINLQYSTISAANTAMTTTHTRERILSFFSNVAYDYNSKYLLSFSARYDGYSKLINNRWGMFPGVSAAWNIHREKFMEGALGGNLTSLKIRAGYGQNGNVNIVAGPYDLQGDYGRTANYNGEYGILINKLPYPDLRWEKTTSTDIAVEASYKSKYRLMVGAFNKLTSDLLATVPFPSSSGVANQYTNNGSVRSRGLEIEADVVLLRSKDWNVKLGANATYVRSKIMTLPSNGNLNNRQGGSQVYDPVSGELIWVGGYQQGQEYGVSYAFQMVDIVRTEADLERFAWYVDKFPTKSIYGPAAWNTLTAEQQATGQKLGLGDAIFYDVNGDGVIDAYDKIKMGNTVPRWMGGVNLSADWKGLSLFTRFDFAAGYTMQNSRKQYYMACNQGTFNTLTEIKDSWLPENPNAKYPVFMYADGSNRANYRTSNIYYDDASYFCAREITLSYTIPQKWAQAVKMQRMTLSVTGQNLFYLTNSTLFNPEYGSDAQGGYPAPRTIFFGIKATF